MGKDTLLLDTQYVRGVMFPEKETTITFELTQKDGIESYLQKVLNNQGRRYLYRNTTADDAEFRCYMDKYLKIAVNLIITDRDRTGICLCCDVDRMQRIFLLKGYITKDDVMYSEYEMHPDAPLELLNTTLLRSMCHSNCFRNGDMLYEQYLDDMVKYPSADKLMNQMLWSKFELDLNQFNPDNLYYLYNYSKHSKFSSNCLNFFYVVTCGLRSRRIPKGFIWLDKERYRATHRCRTVTQMASMFGDPIVPLNRDIRFSEPHREMLDAIFNTKKLF